ncbi:pentatricopeptide repeat-containing protein At1g10270-like isoform X2 [Cottoperca gobio]|uniref:Pentatricopeptide repeat-containing protein At1g10270-like isoform X2 n=1 Tax=Cottoperca gobio TaxID=56716 RepID=A0A6J2RNX6_COTGO|nr:pentatricopeptide repeat-containing protein At1g10270-like isoform X2 [Cottoperca gobio]
MGDVWLLVCVLTVCLAEGSCLSIRDINERSGEGLQRTSRELSPNDASIKKAFALLQSITSLFEQEELSPNDTSIKKAFALLQSITSFFEQEVQLETNEVEADASVGHLKQKAQSRPEDLKTEKQDYEPQWDKSNETASDHNVHYASQNETASDHYAWKNETASDHYAWKNETASDHYAWKNETASDHYAWKNGTASDHYAWKNGTASDHYASKNGTASDHYMLNETASDVST